MIGGVAGWLAEAVAMAGAPLVAEGTGWAWVDEPCDDPELTDRAWTARTGAPATAPATQAARVAAVEAARLRGALRKEQGEARRAEKARKKREKARAQAAGDRDKAMAAGASGRAEIAAAVRAIVAERARRRVEGVMERRESRLRELLDDAYEPLTSRAASELTGWTTVACRRALQSLGDQGLALDVGRGEWVAR